MTHEVGHGEGSLGGPSTRGQVRQRWPEQSVVGEAEQRRHMRLGATAGKPDRDDDGRG
jgi:hypothetical protein